MELRTGLSQKQIKRSLGNLEEEYWERFMALQVKMSGKLNTVMKYTVCLKL
jgi:hypothetical protein